MRFASLVAAASKVRTKKINPFRAEKDHYSQEPFERFSAAKIRPTQTLKNSASDPSLPRPRLADRLPVATYLNSTPLGKAATPSSKHNRRPPKPSPVMFDQNGHHQSHEVNMGLFHGVTVAGGGKRLSVMAPVVPKTERQLEREQLSHSFQVLYRLDSTSIMRQTVFIEDMMEAMKTNEEFKRCFLGTIFWPTLKAKNYKRIQASLLEYAKDEAGQTISFDGFFEYVRSLYHETGVDQRCIQDLLSSIDTESGLRREVQAFSVGQRVEVRAAKGPFRLPGVITKVGSTHTGDHNKYSVKYDLVMAWRKVISTGLGAGDGVDIFKKNVGDDEDEEKDDITRMALGALVLEHGADEDDISVAEADGDLTLIDSKFGAQESSLEGGGMEKFKREVDAIEYAFELLQDNTDAEDVSKLKKDDILRAFTAAVLQEDEDDTEGRVKEDGEGEDGLGDYEINLEEQTAAISALKSVLNKSSALLALVEMDKVKEAFLAMDENDVVVNEDSYADVIVPDDISKQAFVEFFLTISDVLRFNELKIGL